MTRNTDNNVKSFNRWKNKIKINKELAIIQGLNEDQVTHIEALNEARLDLEETMGRESGYDALHALAEEWTVLQFKLQAAWGFLPDEVYHKFWEVPNCICPKLDNEDNYPSGYYYRDYECQVHGSLNKDPINLYNIKEDD